MKTRGVVFHFTHVSKALLGGLQQQIRGIAVAFEKGGHFSAFFAGTNHPQSRDSGGARTGNMEFCFYSA